MDKKTMQHLIQEAISKELGFGFYVSIQKVFKTNQKLDGLVISRKGECLSPTIYLEPFYRALEDGTPLNEVINQILLSYLRFRAQKPSLPLDAKSVMDFNQIKGRLYVALINRHRNAELLQDIPHLMFLDDFAVTARCLVASADDSTSSFLIHNSHLGIWNLDSEALLHLAIQNTRELFGLDLRSMEDALKEMAPRCAENVFQIPIWIMTNRRNHYGAATALFDDALKAFADVHGSFYLVFSSVHELLLIPESENIDIDSVSEINREVNSAEVREEEILGTKAYYYSREKGFVL